MGKRGKLAALTVALIAYRELEEHERRAKTFQLFVLLLVVAGQLCHTRTSHLLGLMELDEVVEQEYRLATGLRVLKVPQVIKRVVTCTTTTRTCSLCAGLESSHGVYLAGYDDK